MRNLKTILVLLLIIVALIFAIQNTATVEIQFLVWNYAMPRSLMTFSLIGIGFVIGLLVFSLLFRRRRD